MANILKSAINTILGFFNLKLIRTNNSILTGLYLWEDIRQILNKETPLVLDIGANVGQTIDDVLRVFKGPEIFSFEPSSKTFKVLKETHSQPNIKLFNVAMGESVGTLEFINYKGNTLSSFLELDKHQSNRFSSVSIDSRETVRVDTVDNFLASHRIQMVDLLKIDVQGFDLKVLMGAHEHLKNKSISHVLVEINMISLYQRQCTYLEIFDFMSMMGYGLVDLYEKERDQYCINWSTALFRLREERADG